MLHKGPFVQHIPSRSSSGATARGRVDRGRDAAIPRSPPRSTSTGRSAAPGPVPLRNWCAEHKRGFLFYQKPFINGPFGDPTWKRNSENWNFATEPTYVMLYQREHGGQLPSNMPIVYDYLLLAGENNWFVPPAVNVSTKNVEAIQVVTSTQTVQK